MAHRSHNGASRGGCAESVAQAAGVRSREQPAEKSVVRSMSTAAPTHLRCSHAVPPNTGARFATPEGSAGCGRTCALGWLHGGVAPSIWSRRLLAGLTALWEGRVDRLTLIERDAELAQLWQVIFSPEGNELGDRVVRTGSVAAAHAALKKPPVDRVDRALHTFLRNRLSFDGILAPGAGRLGPGALPRSWRYSPPNLAARIYRLAARWQDVEVSARADSGPRR